VDVVDVNDNSPYFSNQTPHTFEILENSPVGTGIGSIEAFDDDHGMYGKIFYSVLSNIVEINGTNGLLYSTGIIDREYRESYIIVITATDGGGLATTVSIELEIIDENDNLPVFVTTVIVGYVNEGEIGLQNDLHIRITDDDVGQNGHISLYVKNEAERFNVTQISDTEWILDTMVEFWLPSDAICAGDTVLFGTYTLVAHDNGQNQHFVEKNFSINVLDVNNHAPVIAAVSEIVLVERSVVRTVLAHFDVSDADPCSPNNLHVLSLTGSYADLFRLDGANLLTANDEIDFESFDEKIELNLTALDRGTPRLSNVLPISVVVTDINDENPEITNCSIIDKIEENVSLDTVIGTCVVSDRDKMAMLTYDLICVCQKYFLIQPCPVFTVFPDIGSSIKISVSSEIDFEEVSEVECRMQVTDNAASPNFSPQSASKLFAVTVVDLNDNIPYFPVEKFTFSVPENTGSEHVVGTVRASDFDVSDEIIYSLAESTHVAISHEFGEITIIKSFDYE